MSLFDVESAPARSYREPIPMSDIDTALTAQLVVAWAGEEGEDRRLGWWRSDLASEYGGEDLFRRMMPSTWRWASLQGAREAGRRVDTELRQRDHEPDRIVSLFSMGFELDERIEERLAELKRSGRTPVHALPGLAITDDGWQAESFWDWVAGHGAASGAVSPIGRQLGRNVPATLGQRVRDLVAGLAPTGDSYPLPHFRRAL